MQNYLVFQLYAPLLSWGEQTSGQERPSADHPSRSALLGLLAAALGIDRSDDEQQQTLAANCRFGVKLCAPGLALRDFHTAQVPSTKKKSNYRYTRRDELATAELGTILSFRTYRQDSLSVVAVWLETSAPCQYSLDEIQRALQRPHFPLYLGRKSCPLALPLHPCPIQHSSLQAALDQYEPASAVAMLHRNELPRYYWEHGERIGMDGLEAYRVPRYDQPLSRRRWQFASRDEYVSFAEGSSHVSE